MTMEARRLLLDFVYDNPVGHTAEALKYAKGFAIANPDVEVHLVHRSDAPYELAEGCDWISRVYPIELREFDLDDDGVPASLGAVPRSWDWVVENNLIEIETNNPSALGRDAEVAGREERAMLHYLSASRSWLQGERGRGTLYPSLRLPRGLGYQTGAPIRIRLPPTARNPVGEPGGEGLRICVMLGGSAGYSHYPSVRSWAKILRHLEDAYPDSHIYLTGVTRSGDGRTSSSYRYANIETIMRGRRDVTPVYDIGIWNQLAHRRGWHADRPIRNGAG
jgi:hypothetical protein